MKALYVGSFDPFTLGHLNIALRAKNMFGGLTIGVGNNPSKKYMFSIAERCSLIKRTMPDVQIVEIRNLTADYAHKNGFTHLIKGARTSQDFDYEKLINEVTLTQQRNLETILMFSDTRLSHISSSAAKELAKFQGLIHEYVPLHTKEAIEAKLGQAIVGVTGTIGSGKSTFCNNLVNNTASWGVSNVIHVNMDGLAHKLLNDDFHLAVETRKKITDAFKTTDRKELGKIVFGNKDALNTLNDIYREPILTLLREELFEKKGIILLEGALLAELDWLFLCNNNVILIQEPDSRTHLRRLVSRGYTNEQINSRLASQYNYAEKKSIIEKRIQRDSQGTLISQKSGFVSNHDLFLFLHNLNSVLKTVNS